MNTGGRRARPRSAREREREIRMTRSEGARRALRGRHAREADAYPRAAARVPDERRRTFPGRTRVASFARRVERLMRPREPS